MRVIFLLAGRIGGNLVGLVTARMEVTEQEDKQKQIDALLREYHRLRVKDIDIVYNPLREKIEEWGGR